MPPTVLEHGKASQRHIAVNSKWNYSQTMQGLHLTADLHDCRCEARWLLDAAALGEACLDAVRAAGLQSSVTVQSFDWRTLLEVRRLAPEIATACLTIETERSSTVRPGPDGASPWHAGLKAADHGGSVPRLVAAAGCSTWSMFWRDLTEPRVREAKALGLKVLPWTVNATADMKRLIDWGVDGLITDYPDRLIELRRAQ